MLLKNTIYEDASLVRLEPYIREKLDEIAGDQRGLMTLFGYEWPTRVKIGKIINGTVYCWRQRPYNVWRLYSQYSILSLVLTREAA
jgi:hypothetical protein